MATLIPSLRGCVARMTAGERRLAERLEQKLEDDYLLWYDVPVGPAQSHPDFIVLHPRRGILILETKDWRLDTIRQASRGDWQILDGEQVKAVANPLEQARHCAHQVVDALKRDARLTHGDGPYRGNLVCPWGYGVVLTRITRQQFENAGLGEAIDARLVICQDEMTEACDAEVFQQRLWQMFPQPFRAQLDLPQIDRVRWILFPEVRVPTQAALFDDQDPDFALPDVMRVMDIQQEQLARSLGDGHRVIHGVAGSGKTMILGYRAEQLAKAGGERAKPILVLCRNEPLGLKLRAGFEAKSLADRVHVRRFHQWCHQQLIAFGQTLPPNGSKDFFEQLVDRVIRGVERAQIPAGQYHAVLIDEGHDFRSEWLKLIVQMVDPATNRLLLLYDDAQSINERPHDRGFSFKSVGIQAQGRTTILKINYRNTRQILQVASRIAADLLTPEERDDDGVPLIRPISSGREGEEPLIVKLPTLRNEADRIAELLAAARREGSAWGDMAILCADSPTMDACGDALARRKLPHALRRRTGDFRPGDDTIKVMSMRVSKGLEFPVVALAGVGRMPKQGADEREEARVFYVAATRATHKLLIGVSGDGAFGQRLQG